MRVVICSSDMEERHILSKMLESVLLRQGILPEVVLLPMKQELIEALIYQKKSFDIVLVSGVWDVAVMQEICRCVPVIMVGGKDRGPAAFAADARYFIESPASQEALEKAIPRCLGENKKEEII